MNPLESDPPNSNAGPIVPASGTARAGQPGSPGIGTPHGGPAAWHDSHGLPLPAMASSFAIDSLIKAFRMRWLSASLAGLFLASLAATAVWFLVPAKYTVYALLRVSATAPELLSDNRASSGIDPIFENTQVALVKSRRIVKAALLKRGVSELSCVRERVDPAGWLEDELSAAFIDKTNILRVSLSGSDPRELVTLVSAITDAYLEQGLNSDRSEKMTRWQEAEKICGDKEDKLRKARSELGQLADTLSTSDSQTLTAKQKFSMEKFAALTKDLMAVQAQLRNAEMKQASRKARLRNIDKLEIPEYQIEPYLHADPLVAQKMLDMSKAETNLEKTKKDAEPDSTFVQKSKAHLELAQRELTRLKAERRAGVIKFLRAKVHGDLENECTELQDNIDNLKKQETLLAEQVDKSGKETQSIGIRSFELEAKREEIANLDALVKKLREKKDRLEVELESSKQRVDIDTPAAIPESKNVKAQLRATAFAGFIGFFLAAFTVTFWESRARRISGTEEVVHDLNLKVIGVIPSFAGVPGAGEYYASAAASLESLLIESVDSVRAMLLCGTGCESYRLLMVTSAHAREGKSTLASHLAVSMARCGKRTLLIDADLRRPKLHRVFGVPVGPGFKEVLHGEVPLADAVQQGPVDQLFFLPAGNSPHLAVPMLPREETSRFFEHVRQSYDFVIVDSSPVLPVADALWLGKRVDGVVLSILSHLSRVPSVYAAYERLRAVRVLVLGAVVNGVRNFRNSEDYRYLIQHNDATGAAPAANLDGEP